jgi:hypothetical protein
MAGLKDRFITLEFPELTEDGDQLLFVTIRNPQLVPLDELVSDVATDTNGAPLNPKSALWESYERVANLAVDYRMYDSSSREVDQPLLDLPATAEKVSKFPQVVQLRIAEEMNKGANGSPSTTPDSPTS